MLMSHWTQTILLKIVHTKQVSTQHMLGYAISLGVNICRLVHKRQVSTQQSVRRVSDEFYCSLTHHNLMRERMDHKKMS